MTDLLMFKDLPATFPEKDQYQKPSVLSSIAFHMLLITALVFVPLLFSPNFEPWVTTLLVSPLPPPPAAPPAPIEVVTVRKAAPAAVMEVMPGGDALVSPAMVPRDIAIVVEEPVPTTGVLGGVPGGVPGGITSGILGGFLAANKRALEVADPPPPPPLPPAPPPSILTAPIRIGGDVREPKIVKLVAPVYPQLAQTARVNGTVVLEATLTVDGTVDEIRVISGHPLLIDAAIACVKQWQYEPTYLNGSPVAVILTAKVTFARKITF
jgi:protein TonB